MKNILEITEQEKKALERYTGFAHININQLLEKDINVAYVMQEKGYYINFSEEEIKKNLTSIEDIYSAMCKYATSNKCYKKLFRGTSEKELRKVNKETSYTKCLSCTNDLTQAKRFTEYKDAALIKISVDTNIPFVDVNDVIDVPTEQENEIILSPFLKVKDFKKEYKLHSDVYNVYDISLEKDLKEVEEVKVEKAYKEINLNAKKLNTLLEEYTKLYKRGRYEDFNRILEIEKEYASIKENIILYSKSRCYKKEKEIENKKNIDKQKKEVNEKEKTVKTEQEYELYNKKEADKNAKGVIEDIEESLFKMQTKEEKYDKLNKKLGFKEREKTEEKNIISLIRETRKNINSLVEKINEINIEETDTSETIMEKQKNINILSLKIMNAKEKSENLGSYIQGIDDEETNNIKMQLCQKVNDNIVEEKLKYLKAKERKIKEKKINIIGKILGKEKIKRKELEKIKLEQELEKLKGKEVKEESIEELVAKIDITVSKYLNGNYPKNLQKLEESICDNFYVDNKKVNEIIDEKQNKKSLIKLDENKNIFETKYSKIDKEVEKIKTEISVKKENNLNKNEMQDSLENKVIKNSNKKLIIQNIKNINNEIEIKEETKFEKEMIK